ncbi:MAG: class I SAM-dependent methyltransferase [bacterium]
MVRQRVVETTEGIQDLYTVEIFDRMQRRFRDKGWMEINALLASGITRGEVLEIGPGPGYLGLEWLKRTEGTRLVGLDISSAMIELAKRNAAEYGLSDRYELMPGVGDKIPFEDNRFDGVVAANTLHEWEHPADTLAEIWRVLKPGGRLFLHDLRRDTSLPMRWFLHLATRPKEILPGLHSSLNAAYTKAEVKALFAASPFGAGTVKTNLIGLNAVAVK